MPEVQAWQTEARVLSIGPSRPGQEDFGSQEGRTRGYVGTEETPKGWQG